VRALIRLRELLAANSALARTLDEFKHKRHDDAMAAILSTLRELMHAPATKRRGIGLNADLD
jgi:hypothetical protein